MTIHKDAHAPTTFTLYNFGHCHGLHLMCLALLLHVLSATAQLPSRVAPPPPSIPDPFSRLKFDKNMAIVMVILVVVFFILGFLSVYTRQCAERGGSRGRLDLTLPIGVSSGRSRGLDREIISTFPTLVYSTVKGLKMGRNTLECAVCLNEFEDDETLRLIPKCSHVFHPDCIDMWLASHTTCPLCRANLIPRSGEAALVAIQIPDPGSESHDGDEVNRDRMAEESPMMRDGKRGLGSRSRGFGNGIFPRSHSTGHSLEGENWERFTLRLPEEARKQIVNRTNSCVTFRRERSQRRSYRTRSVGVDEGERWGFTMRPPFLSRTASNQPPMPMPMDNIGERSSDPLFPGNNH